MSLMKALCTNCNSELKVDDSSDAAICPICKTAFVVEKAINNYNNLGTSSQEAQRYYETWIKLRKCWVDSGYKDYSVETALDKVDIEFTTKYVDDYRRRFCDAIALTHDFQPKTIFTSENEYGDVLTYVDVGGLLESKKLKEIRDDIALHRNEKQAQAMLAKIDEQLQLVEEAEAEILPNLPSYYGRNVIKIEKVAKKKRGVFPRLFNS